MRLLILSDPHDHWETLRIEAAIEAAHGGERAIDAVLFAGDLTEIGRRGSAHFVEAAREKLRELAATIAPVYWIPGNHDIAIGCELTEGVADVECVLDRQASISSQEGQTMTVWGVCMCPAYDAPALAEIYDHTTLDWAQECNAYDMPAVDIVLSHCPPHGMLDIWRSTPADVEPHSIGSVALAEYIARHAPTLVVCGHVHDDPGEATIGRTRVVNTACRSRVIDV